MLLRAITRSVHFCLPVLLLVLVWGTGGRFGSQAELFQPLRDDLPTPVPTVTPRPTSIPTAGSTPLLTATTWSTFTYRSSLYIFVPYPSVWTVDIVESSSALSRIRFAPPPHQLEGAISQTIIELRISRQISPGSDEAEWLWQSPLTAAGMTGVMLVRSPINQEDSPRLEAIYRDPGGQFEVDFSMALDEDSLAAAQAQGFPDMIAQRFNIFETMVKGVSFFDPESIPTPTPVPGPEWSTYTTPQGVMFEYPVGWQVKVLKNSTDWWGSFKAFGGDYEPVPSYYYVEAMVRSQRPPDQSTEIAWERPLVSEQVEGVMRITGSLRDYIKKDTRLNLEAVYVSPGQDLRVDLKAVLGDESRNLVRTQGLTATIAQSFQVFEHMAETVKFNVVPTPAPTPTPTPTALPDLPLTVTNWTTFTQQVSPTLVLPYPAGWAVWLTQLEYDAWVNFMPPGPSLDTPAHNVRLSLRKLPREDRASFDPRYNPGAWGTEPLWLKPVNASGASGLMYVLADPFGNYDPVSRLSLMTLNAHLYSEDYELAIELSTDLDRDSLKLVATQGLTETMTQRFQLFEQMVNQVQLPPLPVPRPTSTPIPNPLPQPPAASAWTTATLSSFKIEYPADWWILKQFLPPPMPSLRGSFTIPADPGVEIPNSYLIEFEERGLENYNPQTSPNVADALPHSGVLWQKRVTAEAIEGIIYIEGNPKNWQTGNTLLLHAVFYNLREGTSLFLTTTIDDPASLTIARTQGFEAMMAQHFQVFEHIANSVRPTSPR